MNEKTPTEMLRQELEEKRTTQAQVHAEQERLSQQLPALEARARKAAEVLQQAKLAAILAKGTPGFEDDSKADASVKNAQAQLDEACRARDDAQDQAEVLAQAAKQLGAEVDKLATRQHQAHLDACRRELAARVERGKESFKAFLVDVTALRAVGGEPTWPENFVQICETQLGISMPACVKAGHVIADRVRGGGEVGP